MSLTLLNDVISIIHNYYYYYYYYYYYIVLIVYQTLCNSRCSCLLDSNKITTLIGQGEIKIIKIAYGVKMLFKFTSLE